MPPRFAACAVDWQIASAPERPPRFPVYRPEVVKMMFGESRKFAATFVSAPSVTVQVPVPVHAPDHPTNVESVVAAELGVAVNVMLVPVATVSVQSTPQVMPVPVTVPAPLPIFETVSVKVSSVNVAVTLRPPVIVSMQGEVPVQAPLQPVNVEPVAGVAINVSGVPQP